MNEAVNLWTTCPITASTCDAGHQNVGQPLYSLCDRAYDVAVTDSVADITKAVDNLGTTVDGPQRKSMRCAFWAAESTPETIASESAAAPVGPFSRRARIGFGAEITEISTSG